MPSLVSSHLLIGAVAAAALFGCYGMAGTTATADPNAPTVDGNATPSSPMSPVTWRPFSRTTAVVPRRDASGGRVATGDLGRSDEPSVSDSSVSARHARSRASRTGRCRRPGRSDAGRDRRVRRLGRQRNAEGHLVWTPRRPARTRTTPRSRGTTGKNSNISEGSTMEPAARASRVTRVRRAQVQHRRHRLPDGPRDRIAAWGRPRSRSSSPTRTTRSSRHEQLGGNFSLQPSQMAGFAPRTPRRSSRAPTSAR